MSKPMDAVSLIINGSNGQYVPQYFATQFTFQHIDGKGWANVEPADLAILAHGPEHEHYDDAWCSVVDNAQAIDVDGSVFTLYQDSDVWMICVDKMTADERQQFHIDD